MKDIKFVSNVSMSIFSVARFSGGCKIGGKSFTYFADEDVLVRKDYVRAYKKARKEGKTLQQFANEVSKTPGMPL